MKKLFIAMILLLPLTVLAQDNTWERIEQEPVENPDAKYLLPGAVPICDGKVCFETTIQAPGKTADQIYHILLKQLTKMTKESNQLKNSLVAIQDSNRYQLGAVFHEWLVFKNSSLSLDQTQFHFRILANCADGKAEIKISHIYYDYDVDRKPIRYSAEEWITDKFSVNKKRTKLYPISGKFRRKTIDRKDFIFKKLDTILNESK
jgi:colicin import membrane protein